ncbi:MAG: bifunctional DNA-formamidopyrimidine glycosylase/DNA-(apurinic or apyrimidinic site) lyase [Luteolibacter sp.]
MPELPEVETTRRGIEPYVAGCKIREVIVRRKDLRWPVSESVSELAGFAVTRVERRSKYLLLGFSDETTLMIHLGMSGSLRIVGPGDDWKKHDHVALTLSNGKQLRFHDPRRFGLVLHVAGDVSAHPLLSSLGPEPLGGDFTPAYLFAACARRSAAIKLVIMDAKVVVGVGNIYASEALFRAGIRPQVAANGLTKPRVAKLVKAIREVLQASIEQGGTTLRDFLNSDGEPGYFSQRLFVYGRKGEPCRKCGTRIEHAVLGQRATYWCPKCQRG